MSITSVKAAFDRGLAGKATCIAATMDYGDGGRSQVLRFTLSDGTVVEATAAPQDDLALVARQTAEQHAATLG